MARRAKDDYCLICSASPCECNKKAASPKSVSRKTVTSTPVTPAPPATQPTRRAGLGAVRRIAPSAPTQKPVTRHKVARIEPSSDDLDMARAVTVLVKAGLVSEASIQEHRRFVNLTDTEIRAILWKQRHQEGGSQCR